MRCQQVVARAKRTARQGNMDARGGKEAAKQRAIAAKKTRTATKQPRIPSVVKRPRLFKAGNKQSDVSCFIDVN